MRTGTPKLCRHQPRSGGRHRSRSYAVAIGTAAVTLMLHAAPTALAADIVQQIASRIGNRPTSYTDMTMRVLRLAQSPRVSVVKVGRSAKGRDIWCVAVHDPRTVFGQGMRMMVLARQHGSETSGTEALLALLDHFAKSEGELERGTRQRLTIIGIPMVNPDGAVRYSRENANGVDLNRDWADLSQPETRAVEAAVRAWKPHAILDLHELPQGAPKAAYAENFIETVGSGPGVPQALSAHTLMVATDLAGWLKTYGYRANIYYDGPGKDTRLCHRRYGLKFGIPSFLVEAKTGPGRSLKERASLHILAMLVVANHLLHCGAPGGGTLVAQAPAAAPRPPHAQPATTVELRVSGEKGAEHLAAGEVEATLRGVNAVRYIKFYVDGHLHAVTNMAPYRCRVPMAGQGGGEHAVRAQVIGEGGEVIAEAQRTLNLAAVAVAE